MLPPAAYACGRVTLVDFSFDIDGHMPFVEAVSGDNAAETVRLPRLADTKYLRGVTGLITGSERYPGAAVLSCKAAAKTNIGMIRYMADAQLLQVVKAGGGAFLRLRAVRSASVPAQKSQVPEPAAQSSGYRESQVPSPLIKDIVG